MTPPQTNTTTSTSGIGFTGALTIAFIILKLMHFITWSWWWVLSPLWIGFALFLGVMTIVVLVALITHLVSNR